MTSLRSGVKLGLGLNMKKTINFPDEVKYFGEVKKGKPHGKGTLTYPDNGGKYEGQWKNGKYHGKGKLNYGGKQGEYIGEFKNGKCDGYGEFKQRGVQKYSGNWKNGKYHGQGTLKHYKEVYSGIFKNGELPSIYLEPKGNNINQTKNNLVMKNLSISILKKKIFLRDLLRRMKDMPNVSIEGMLIDEILLNSEFIDYDTNDMSEEKYDALVKLYKRIKRTDLYNLYNNLFDGKLLSKLAVGFELIFYFEFREECHYLIFSKYNKMYFHIYVLKEKNKPISKSNKLIYGCVLNATKKKLNKSKFFELIIKFNEVSEDNFMERYKSGVTSSGKTFTLHYEERERMWEEHAYVGNKGINYYDLYKKGKLK